MLYLIQLLIVYYHDKKLIYIDLVNSLLQKEMQKLELILELKNLCKLHDTILLLSKLELLWKKLLNKSSTRKPSTTNIS